MKKNEKIPEVVNRYLFEEGFSQSKPFLELLELESFRVAFEKALDERVEGYVDKFLDKTYTNKDVEEANYLLEHDANFRKRFAPIIAMDERLNEIRLTAFKAANSEEIEAINAVYKEQSDYLESRKNGK